MDHCFLFVIIACFIGTLSSGLSLKASLKFSDHKLEPKNIQQKCCRNNWDQCCQEVYPWDQKNEETELNYCRRYFKTYSNDSYADQCINNYKLRLDIRKHRNQLYEFHRCYYRKDQTFVDKLLSLEKTIHPAVSECCKLYSSHNTLKYGAVVEHLSEIRIHINRIDVQYQHYTSANHQRSGCAVHGNTAAIGYKLGVAVWKMGIYIKCAKYITCSTN